MRHAARVPCAHQLLHLAHAGQLLGPVDAGQRLPAIAVLGVRRAAEVMPHGEPGDRSPAAAHQEDDGPGAHRLQPAGHVGGRCGGPAAAGLLVGSDPARHRLVHGGHRERLGRGLHVGRLRPPDLTESTHRRPSFPIFVPRPYGRTHGPPEGLPLADRSPPLSPQRGAGGDPAPGPGPGQSWARPVVTRAIMSARRMIPP